MANAFKPPSKRRTQTTQAGMPQVAGRKPYSPPPLLNRQPGMITQTPALGGDTRQVRPGGVPAWQDTSRLSPEQLALKQAAEPYFKQTGERDILGRRIGTAAEHSLALEQMLKERQLGEFNELRRSYLENLGLGMGAVTRGQTGAMEQSLRRKGAEFAGYAPAAEQAIRASVAGKAAETLGEFESQILGIQQQELAYARKGFTDFLSMALTEFRSVENQKDFAKFQQGLQGNSAWDQLMGVAGQVVGAVGGVGAVTGAIGGMFGGGGGGQVPTYAQPQGGTNPAYVGPSLIFR